nr:hypothetical protein [Tanacetum cinerariifolium]
LSDIGSPRADYHEYLMMLEDPYVEVALQASPSPDYMPSPEEPEQAPPSPDYIPGPEHANDEIVAEDQPYAKDASPMAQSPEYVPESDFEMHPEDDDDEDPEEDPVDYPANGGDDGDDEEESSEDEEDDEMDVEADEEVEEEEHPAPADFVVVAPTATDQAPSAEETEPFETDEDRRAHAYTRRLMEAEARMSREAWGRETDASDLVHGEVISLRTTVLGKAGGEGRVLAGMLVKLLFRESNGNACTKANINAEQAGKKIDPVKECDNNDEEKDLRDQEEALRKQFKQESKRLFGQREVVNTNSTNRLNIVSSPVNVVSSSFTTVDPGRERAQRNEFKSMFGQDKDANGNRMFSPISVVGSTYVNLGGSIPVNVVTLHNVDLPTDPLMPDLEDTVDLQDTGIFSGAYDDLIQLWSLMLCAKLLVEGDSKICKELIRKIFMQEVEALRAKAEAADQRAKELQASPEAAQMDIIDLIESCRIDRLEMAKLRGRAHDIKASFWEIERHLGLYTDRLVGPIYKIHGKPQLPPPPTAPPLPPPHHHHTTPFSFFPVNSHRIPPTPPPLPYGSRHHHYTTNTTAAALPPSTTSGRPQPTPPPPLPSSAAALPPPLPQPRLYSRVAAPL